MRISDWSSDVCSSDLVDFELADRQRGVEQRGETGEMALDLAVLIIGDEPGEAAIEIVVEPGAVARQGEAACDLVDELLATLAGQEGGEIFEIDDPRGDHCRSEEHTSELQSLMRISYAVFCLK